MYVNWSRKKSTTLSIKAWWCPDWVASFGTFWDPNANDQVRVTKMISFKKAAEQHPKGYTMKLRNAIIRRQSAAGARAQPSDWMNIVEALILFSFLVLLRRFECQHVAIKNTYQPGLLQLEPLLATGNNPSCGIPTKMACQVMWVMCVQPCRSIQAWRILQGSRNSTVQAIIADLGTATAEMYRFQ